MRVDVKITVGGWAASDDNEGEVTWLPPGSWRGSSVSGDGTTSDLDSNDIVPTPGTGQVVIAHEFGHMIGLEHPSHGLPGVVPNSPVRSAFAFGLRNVHQSHVDGRVAAANVAAGVIALRCSASQRWLSVTRLAVHVSLEPRGRDALLAL